MRSSQRAHIATVMQVAEDGITTPSALSHDQIIRDSWSRCVHEHRLDPTRPQEAIIVPERQLREHQDRIEEFVHIARHGLETLYQQVAGMGYCVLLTDARGITVDFIGDLQIDASLRKAGLYLGSAWSEQLAGTCGVGTCISTGEALTVHLSDHFDATHIPLTCTAAPVYDAAGEMNAVLDISQLSSSLPKQSQHLALQLVKSYAHHIENASFLRRFRNDWVLKLASAPQFLDMNPEYLLALDAGGMLIGHNRRAQLLLEAQWRVPVIGMRFDRLLNATMDDLGRFTAARAPDQRAITLAGSERVVFMLVSPPPLRWAAAQGPTPSERKPPAPLAAMSGGDAALDRQIERAARLVNSPVSILLTGETGSGKEYFAKAVHQASERRSRPFIAVNCAAIPEALIESELFGHLPGSFTGAMARGKRGLVVEADGGTLFLDEIGDMPRDAQARLLRVLAEREVLPVGASRPIAVNLRVISATHRDLVALVREGRFRDDLYYRLNGAHLPLPPLRNREDFDWLVRRMLREAVHHAAHDALHNASHDASRDASHRAPKASRNPCDGAPHIAAAAVPDTAADNAPEVAPEAMEWLRAWRWPGNLRELRNVLEYARAVCSGGYIRLGDLPDELLTASVQSTSTSQDPQPLPPEAQLLLQYLRAAHWNVTAVAHQMGVARMTLYRRMKRWGLRAPNHDH